MYGQPRGGLSAFLSGRRKNTESAVHARHIGMLFLRQFKSEREQCAKTTPFLGFGRRVGGWEWESGNPWVTWVTCILYVGYLHTFTHKRTHCKMQLPCAGTQDLLRPMVANMYQSTWALTKVPAPLLQSTLNTLV